jgi:hypothetical protein
MQGRCTRSAMYALAALRHSSQRQPRLLYALRVPWRGSSSAKVRFGLVLDGII